MDVVGSHDGRMSLLASWTKGSHTADGRTYDTFRKGSGPGVVIIHEIPGMTPEVIAFGEEVVAAGYTVVMPNLFGTPEAGDSAANSIKVLGKVCVSKEFVTMATGRTAPVAGWLRSLARALHTELGGPGVGALGMCFTGGFALAMMVDDSVVAPVLTQPSSPFPVTPRLAADLNLSPADLATVKERANAGCAVLGLRYASDRATGTRFETLTRELGSNFIKIEFPGKGHSTVTRHRQQEGVDAILEFFGERLR